MPGRHHGSTNKNQNPNNTPKNQGSSTPGGQHKASTTPGGQRPTGSSTPSGQRPTGSSTPGGQHKASTTPGGQRPTGSSTPGGHRGSTPGGSSLQGPQAGRLQAFEDRTKEELYAQAKKEGIEGRSKMSKEELIRALRH